MRWIDNWNVGQKLVGKFIITLLGLTIMAGVGLAGLRLQMWADRESQVRVAVGVAEGVANAIDAQVRAGEMTRQEGQVRLLKILQATRYDMDKYFAVVLDDGTFLVHGGNPPSVGTNDWDKQDVPGHYYMRLSIAAAHQQPQGAFFSVYANLPGGPRMKINFIKALPDWGFLLVSGLVVNDVNQAVLAEAKLMAAYAVPVILLCAVAAGLIRRSVVFGLRHLRGAIGQLASGQLDIQVPCVERRDEIGQIGRGIEMFRQSMIETESLRQAHEAQKQREAEAQRMLDLARSAMAQAEAARRVAEAELALGRERERADEALRIQAMRFGAALGTMSEVLCMFDAADRLLVGNERLSAVLDLPGGGIAPGMTIQQMGAMLSNDAAARATEARTLYDLILRLRAEGRRQSKVHDFPSGGRIAVNYAPMDHDGDPPTENDGWLVTLEDITAQRQAEARIAHMAHHDALTGLANRTLFHQRLGEAMAGCRRGAQFAVLYLDLDHFKAVNDTLGHPMGDALLCSVTERLMRQVRETDTIARLGGDEFAILMGDIDRPEDSAALAQRLIEAIGAPYELDGNQVVIGTSIGIAIAPDDADNADEIIKHADTALYRSKAGGRGRYQFFEPEMEIQVHARRTLENDLAKALDDDQFRVFYQPLVTIANGSVCGFEALLRWQNPRQGLMTSVAFVPVAEEIGLLPLLDRWVLCQACADAATWPRDIKVAVNLSALHFSTDSLVDDVAAALSQAGLDPCRLELEVTESAILANTAEALSVLSRLHDLGVRIGLDDFGTGYSSMTHLRRFPFNKIKIDRSFIAGLGQAGDSDTIVAGLIDLAGNLGMTTTAEGVETAEQLGRLAALRCVEAQGFLFSSARPASEVGQMLRTLAPRSAAAAVT